MKPLRYKPHYYFLSPSAVLLILVAVFPLVYVFYLSLQKKNIIAGISKLIFLENYSSLLKDDRFWNALFNTIYFTVVSVSIELLLGLAIAIIINRHFRGRGIMRAVLLIPWAIPTVVSAKMWEWMYNPDFGVINYLFNLNINWLGNVNWAMHAAIIVDVWKTTPFVVLLLTAGLSAIPRDYYMAARVDGASPWTVFLRITLPLLKPVILITLIFRTIDAFRVFDVIYVLTGGGPANQTETLSIYAYKVLFQTLQFGYGSAISVIIFLCVGTISVFYIKLLSKGMD